MNVGYRENVMPPLSQRAGADEEIEYAWGDFGGPDAQFKFINGAWHVIEGDGCVWRAYETPKGKTSFECMCRPGAE